MSHKKLLFILVCTILGTHIAVALQSDKEEPLNISSDYAKFDHQRGVNIFIGDVKADKGTSHLRSTKLLTYTDKNNKVKEIIATGKPAHYWTLPKAGKPALHAKANKIKYYPATDKVLLIDHAEAYQANKVIKGQLITYLLKQQILSSSPRAKSRTTIIITANPTAKDKTA